MCIPLQSNRNQQQNPKSVFTWFVTSIIPIVHISSRVHNNWHSFAFTKGSPPLYSTFVTSSSDEAFALFLIKHYRYPPPVKEKFAKISKTVLKIEKKKMKTKMRTTMWLPMMQMEVQKQQKKKTMMTKKHN